jgi:hypothetical protein
LWLWLVNNFYRLCCLQPYTSWYTQVHSAWTVAQWASHSQMWCFQFGSHRMQSSPHWNVLGLGKVSSQWTQLTLVPHSGLNFYQLSAEILIWSNFGSSGTWYVQHWHLLSINSMVNLDCQVWIWQVMEIPIGPFNIHF